MATMVDYINIYTTVNNSGIIDYIKKELPFSEEKISKRIDEILDGSKSN